MRSYTDEQLINAVTVSKSLAGVLRFLGIRVGGGTSRCVKRHITRLELDISHFVIPKPIPIKLDPKLVFIQNSSTFSSSLKDIVLREKIINYECVVCNNKGFHEGKTLVLQLDHINGIVTDNRIENLRFLCPNCHSQTSTYSRRKSKPLKIPNRLCDSCGITFYRKSHGGLKTFCSAKCNITPSKIIWPSNKELAELVNIIPLTKLAKKLGVSDVTIKKKCKQIGIETHGPGYWSGC